MKTDLDPQSGERWDRNEVKQKAIKQSINKPKNPSCCLCYYQAFLALVMVTFLMLHFPHEYIGILRIVHVLELNDYYLLINSRIYIYTYVFCIFSVIKNNPNQKEDHLIVA